MEDKAINISEFKLGGSPVPYQARNQVATAIEAAIETRPNRDLPETIRDWHRELPLFISYVEDKLLALASGVNAASEFASRAMLVMREIFRRETGLASLEALDDFAFALWGSAGEKEMIRALVKRLEQALKTGDRTGDRTGNRAAPELLRQMLSFLNWYALRKRSLLQIVEQERYYRFESNEKDRIFDFQVYSDVVDYGGLRGFKISAGIRLCNHLSEPLWFKVSLRQGEDFIKAAPGWGEWSEEGAKLIGTNGGAHRFVALQPIQPRSQRVLIDKLQLFVPYSALQLESSELDTVLEASVCSQSGEKLLVWTEQEAMVLPRSSEGLFLPSPQTLGLWQRDPVSGDEIKEVSLSAGVREENGQAFGVLRVKSSLCLQDHQGELMKLRYRFLNLKGDLVAAREKSFEMEDGRFGIEQQLYIREATEELRDIELVIPLNALELQKLVYLELSVLDASDRETCGTLAPVRYEHLLSEFHVQHNHIVKNLAPKLHLGVADLHGDVKCIAQFTDMNWASAPGRVVFALRPLGNEFLHDDTQYKVFCLGGSQTSNAAELEVKFSTKRYFDSDEDRKQDLMQFDVSCYLVDLNDTVLNSVSKSISVTRAEKYSKEEQHLPAFVSVRKLQGESLICKIVANLPVGHDSFVLRVGSRLAVPGSQPYHYFDLLPGRVANNGVFEAGVTQVVLNVPLVQLISSGVADQISHGIYFSLLSVDGAELGSFCMGSDAPASADSGKGSNLKSRFRSWATSAFASDA